MNTTKRRAFYSFHYANDVMRAALVRNMGVIEGNRPASDNGWEEVKRGGDAAIQKWIDNQMYGKSVAIVLIGEETAKRKWVKYEIKKAWGKGMGLLGIHIHGLKDPNTGTCRMGQNPFEQFTVRGDYGKTNLSYIVPAHNPQAQEFLGTTVYSEIKDNLADWIEQAIAIRGEYA